MPGDYDFITVFLINVKVITFLFVALDILLLKRYIRSQINKPSVAFLHSKRNSILLILENKNINQKYGIPFFFLFRYNLL